MDQRIDFTQEDFLETKGINFQRYVSSNDIAPYLHAFDGLERVYHHVDEAGLTAALNGAGYHVTDREEYPLPNGKKLLRLDYAADKR